MISHWYDIPVGDILNENTLVGTTSAHAEQNTETGILPFGAAFRYERVSKCRSDCPKNLQFNATPKNYEVMPKEPRNIARGTTDPEY